MRIATETSYHWPETTWKEDFEKYDRGFDEAFKHKCVLCGEKATIMIQGKHYCGECE